MLYDNYDKIKLGGVVIVHHRKGSFPLNWLISCPVSRCTPTCLPPSGTGAASIRRHSLSSHERPHAVSPPTVQSKV